ncbi:RNA polymerase sigma factor [Stakelama marina]|uniref:RNA polymerase sigma factor n=1 Tax=Stakelama marina TaxID=2826939 RepID=A0A8T4II67_9SPHN|nr:RNA polymerase sigma factor [Stakelama marina]MBR0552785.1 RNA polymerase sigma factor [Stakelama marina]
MTPGDGDTEAQEQDLVRRARAGDRAAYDRLIARHAPRLLAIAQATMGNRAEAEDAAQEALAQAWLKLDRFDERRALAPWLARVTLNKCRDLLRRRRWRFFIENPFDRLDPTAEHDRPDPEDPVESIERRDELRRVQAKIARLPASLREPLILVTHEGYSQGEAAAILGISEKAVETRIYRARARLRGGAQKA